MEHYDFSGYATKNDVRCSDGRTIRRNAFVGNDGKTVPLVWNHQHGAINNVLGHALLENRDDGVYAYCSFNNTHEGQRAKVLVAHGDIKQMSIYANQLKQTPNGDVMHGTIREVSLVYSGANPEAYIHTLDIQHSDDPDYDETFEAEIFMGCDLVLSHADEKKEKKPLVVEEETEEIVTEKPEKEEKKMPQSKKADDERTWQDVYEEMTDEQKQLTMYLIGKAIEQTEEENKKSKKDDEAKQSDEGEDSLMHYNVFENDTSEQNELRHAADEFFSETDAIFAEAKRGRSLKDVVIEHAASYGIDQIDTLFPNPRMIENMPGIVNQDQEFVQEFMSKVHKTPFSRIKSVYADLTETEARAKGYTKGNKKLDEVFKLLKRTTTPTTVYKHQNLDRDDIIDITDFDVTLFMKNEMKVKLNEEVVVAALVGDGRGSSAQDKIDEQCIRPIWTDDDLYTVKASVEVENDADEETRAKATIRAIIKARKNYKGSGNPTFFVSEDALTDMLLLEDGVGRALYDTVDKLATKLRVSKIVTVESFENLKRNDAGTDYNLVGIIVNPADYNFGSDKGGEVSLFDDFDIDYNQRKYLIETRLSGALVKPHSAIAVEYYKKA